MSSSGISPLALIAPDLYAQQTAIQQRQALAQALLQQGTGDPGKGAYGGVRSAGNALLGAFLAKSANKDMMGLYAPQQQSQPTWGQPSQIQSQQPQTPETQISNNPGSGPIVQNPQQQSPQANQPISQQDQQTLQQRYGSSEPQQWQAQPQGQRTIPGVMAGAIPDLPGMTHQQSMLEYFQDPSDYWKSLAPTPEYRNALMASGGDTNQAQQLLLGAANKAGTVNITRGMAIGPNGQATYAPPPAPAGYQYVTGQNGQPMLIPTQGGLQAVAGSAFASAVPKAALTPATGYDGNSQPIASNALAMSGNSGILPQLMGGQQQAAQQPQQAPQMAPRPMQSGIPPQPQMAAPAPPQRGAGLLPELPQGQPQYMQAQGKDAADRHDVTVAAAAESPMRINVLDNIINLSRAGVATGPGQEWQNQVLGYAANTPLLSKALGSAKDNVGKFQELQKFTYQNALRNWQAAGGTGTNAQLESAATANPNDHLFPQALQQIATWAKASELAIQGKANAQDKFLQIVGQTPKAQIQFENQWRNSFDPKIFQYSLMSPQERQNFAVTQLKTPQAAKEFLAKQQTLRAMGALQ